VVTFEKNDNRIQKKDKIKEIKLKKEIKESKRREGKKKGCRGWLMLRIGGFWLQVRSRGSTRKKGRRMGAGSWERVRQVTFVGKEGGIGGFFANVGRVRPGGAEQGSTRERKVLGYGLSA
jgi:hypothetical protein